MLVPVILILGVPWLTVVLVVVVACRMAAREDGAASVGAARYSRGDGLIG